MHPQKLARLRRIQLRERLLLNDPHCWFCGSQLAAENATLDHLQPSSRGGSDDRGNLRLCCHRCNWQKRDYELADIAVAVDPRFGIVVAADQLKYMQRMARRQSKSKQTA